MRGCGESIVVETDLPPGLNVEFFVRRLLRYKRIDHDQGECSGSYCPYCEHAKYEARTGAKRNDP